MKKRFIVVSLFAFLMVMMFSMTTMAGWETTSGGYKVYTANGTRLTGWQKIGGKRYYFNPKNGAMATGWVKFGKTTYYYFGSDGVMRTGWQKIGKYTYYFGTDGVSSRGWTSIRDSNGRTYRYYFKPKKGRMLTGFRKIRGKHYYLGETGILQYGWIRARGKIYYADTKTGELYINRWAGNYYFKSDGTLAVNQWVGYKWVGSDGLFTGVINKVGFITEDGNTYYYTNSHERYKNGFITVSGKRYYLDSNGVLATGNKWITVGNYKYYVNKDGEVLRSQWIGKRYVNAEGAMVTGWAQINGARYYFRTNGKRAVFWYQIDGEYYFFNKKGKLQINSWITYNKKKYHTDASGKMLCGLNKVGENYYLFGPKTGSQPGVLLRGSIFLNGARYYADRKTYILYCDRFFRRKIGGRKYTYYAKPNCQLAKGLTMVRGSLYYFDSCNRMVTKQLVTVDGKSYYFRSNGKAKIGGIVTVDGVKYMVGSDGVITGQVSAAYASSAKKFTGWKTVSGHVRYYVNGVKATGWQTISGKKYYFGSDGTMRTGWQTIDGNTYYFASSGAMTTGLAVIDNKKYYFFPSGRMAKNITIAVGAKMYTLRSDGVVKEETPITVKGNTKGAEIAREALNYIGNPYVYGGESLTEGCDCSGFTMLIFRKFGIKLGHYTNWQMNGEYSSKQPVYIEADESKLQPGDLIYYGSGNSSSHVAIYIGEGRIVHASNSQAYPAGGIKLTYNWKYTNVVRVCRYW